MKKVGIFGGSFDPIHNGHISLAQYVLAHTDLDEVWIMVSPLNPLKPQGYVATDAERLDMAHLAVADIPRINVSDFEFSLPIPSYTYNTLCKLKEAYPDIDFRLIIGGDNWAHFDEWKNPQEILSEFGLIVYPRPGEDISPSLHSSLFTLDSSKIRILESAPQMPVSSTQLRSLLNSAYCFAHGKEDFNLPSQSIGNYLPASVLNYIEKQGLYNKSSTQS